MTVLYAAVSSQAWKGRQKPTSAENIFGDGSESAPVLDLLIEPRRKQLPARKPKQETKSRATVSKTFLFGYLAGTLLRS